MELFKFIILVCIGFALCGIGYELKKIRKTLKMKKKYTKKDMFNFSNYIRNGISNLEYCSKTEEEHLKDWITKNPKNE